MTAALMDLVNQLRSTLGTLEIALGAITDALVWTGEDGKIQWCNAAFDQLVNRPHILVLNQPLTELLPLMQAGQPLAPAFYPHVRTLQGDYAVTEYEFQPTNVVFDRPLILEISGNCAATKDHALDESVCGYSAVLVIRDVTQTRQTAVDCQRAEEQQQQFYALMQATLESMDDAVLVLTNDRKTPIYNQKFLTMWSVPEALMQPGREDDRIQLLMDRTKDPNAFLARIWELFRDRPTETALDLVEMKDGRILERLGQPLWNGTQILGRVWTYRDVTANIQCEQAIREREARFRSLVESANDIIFAIDLAGTIVYISPNVTTIMGFTPAEMEGGSFTPFVHADDLQHCLAAIDQVIVNKQSFPNLKYRARSQDGSWRWYVTNLAAPQPVGGDQLIVGVARDITELKQTEEALRQSELRFQALFENAAVGTTLTASNGAVLQVNPAWVQSLGYSEAELYTMNFTDYTHPDDIAIDLALTEEVFAGKRNSFQLEKRYIRKDSSVFWGRLTVSPIRDAEGKTQFTLGLMEDINDRKQAEAALRHSELKYRNIFENSQVGIGRTRLEDGLFLDVNQRYAKIMGFDSPADLIGKRFTTDFYANPDDRQRILAELQQYGEVRNFEEQLCRPDGAIIWGLLSLRPNLEEHCLDFVLVDISDRKRLEEELRQSQQFLDNIIDNIPLAVFAKDVNQDFRYVLTNKSSANILGFTKAAAMGRNDYDLVTQAQADVYRAEDLAALAQGGIVEFPEQWKQIHADSEERVAIQYWKLPLFDPQGNVTHLLSICENITERKQSEEALQQSEARFRALYESTSIAVLLGGNNMLTCNYAAEELFGCTRQDIVNKHPADLSPPFQPDGQDSFGLANQHLAIAHQQGRHRFEWMHRRADGTNFPAEVQLTVFEVNGNKLLQAAIQDLTERKQAEAVLQRRAQVERLLSDISRQFIDQDIDTAAAFTLEAVTAFLGTERSCIFEYSQQQQQFRLTHEWCAATVTPMPDAARESPTAPFPWFYKQILNGQAVHIPCVAELPPDAITEKTVFQSLHIQSIVAVPMLHSGNVVGFIGSDVVRGLKTWSQDEITLMQLIGELIAIGQSRHDAEEKFIKAFRASPSPIAITTLIQKQFIDVNHSFLKMSGCALESIIGHTAADLNLGIASEAYEKTIQQALETGSAQNQEHEFRTWSGAIRTVLLSIELIDLSGTQCVLNILNDITERKRLENELISLVSHELRTPMTSLLGALDLLGSGQLGTLTTQGQQVLAIATNNTERLTRLVNDILDLEQMRSGKTTIQKVWCDAANLLIQAAEAMQAMAAKAQVTLITEPVCIELFADPDRMLQTLINLLSNAIKFSEPGGTVWLSAAIESRQPSLETREELTNHPHSPTPPNILFSIKDQGRGIPADKLQMIFERFQQVDASDSRKKGGTGLGLAICRNLVEQHNGRIWAESVPGEGSTFYMTLPLHP